MICFYAERDGALVRPHVDADPLPFRAFEAQCARHPELSAGAGRLFLALVGSIVERVAQLLEGAEAELDRLSDAIFAEEATGMATQVDAPARGRRARTDAMAVIKQLGRANTLAARLRDSLAGIGRMLAFYRGSMGDRLEEAQRSRVKALERDIRSLAELAHEVGFLLEATPGLIDVEQNRIIGVFTIAAVIALPPTLIGTTYGMNFEHMPELRWRFGYPLALLALGASAVLPYLWFRRRGWLERGDRIGPSWPAHR
ncbi:CorA family divalent cation transporter [Falsiroseomonas oryzae]|uniref:CorA family divalent cation transporter n=1 Tax=Falsiroseomonas oryzae TaxID=2766473 RepID=UPI0022EA37A2|nr:CorA family divalent cation transporter [Roseomonas sp. MO-31]